MTTIALIFGFSIGLVTIAAISMMLLIMTGTRANTREMTSQRMLFVLAAIFVIAFQLLVYKGLSETTLDLAIQNYRLRLDAAHITIIFMVSFVLLNFKPRFYPWMIAIIAMIFIGFTLANHFIETTVAFSQINHLSMLYGPFGSTLSILQGAPSGLGQFRKLCILAVLLALLVLALRNRHEQRLFFANALAVYIIIQLITVAIQVLYVEPNHLRFFPIGGFAFTIFAVLIVYQQFTLQNRLAIAIQQKDSALITEREYRHIAEDQVLMLSKAFKESNAIKHIINQSGRALICNNASRVFWNRNLETDPKSNLIALLNSILSFSHPLPKLCDINSELKIEHIPLIKQRAIDEEPSTHFNLVISPLSSLTKSKDTDVNSNLFVVTLFDVSNKVYLENAIKYVAQGVGAATGKIFFDELVLNLQKLLDTQYAFIGLVDNTDHPTKIETLSLAAYGEISENFTYDLKYTPCEGVIGESACCYPCDIQKLYPQDQLLIDMKIEGYVGSPIINEKKQTIGILVALSEAPLRYIEQLNQILDIFSARASSEMMRMRSEEEVRRLAYEDYLTGLPNRAVSMDYLSSTLSRLVSQQRHAILVMIDFDHFKRINDALGHDVGDEVIRVIGHRLQEYFGQHFFIARLGGDEFMLVKELSSQDTKQQAQEWGQAIIVKISEPINVGDHELELSSSLGIVIMPGDGENVFDLLRAAEIALYKAKENCRKQFAIFNPKDREFIQKRLTIEGKIRKALNNNAFEPFYQQQVNSDGRIISAEALARWIDPIEGIIPPAEFISIAEESGLINQIGLMILEKSVSFIAQHNDIFAANKLPISVNISPWQFARHDFLSSTLSILKRYSVEPHQITLELTESALMANLEEARIKLSKLRNHGFHVSLDDFGTGYSSLAYLRELEIDELKIDKAFIDELLINVRHPLVSSMITIGNNLDLKVIAEGVETQEQRDKLVELGCSIFQGYLFSKPVSRDVFLSQLQQKF